MNKDIQTLIESEACEYWSHSNYKEAAEKAHSENDMCKTSAMARKVSNSSFIDGANFALSLFKWRKVSEELPDVEDEPYQINIRVIGIATSTGVWGIRNESDLTVLRNMKGCEWMPIPQID